MPPLEDILYESTLLDADNQPLAIGSARFDTIQSRGRFWPRSAQNPDQLITSAKKLQTKDDGTVFDLVKIQHLPVGFPNSAGYYEFWF